MRRDPMACPLGTRDHAVNAKRKSLAEEFVSLKNAVKRLEADIHKMLERGYDPDLADHGFEPESATLRYAKLITLRNDHVARARLIAGMIAEGKTFR